MYIGHASLRVPACVSALAAFPHHCVDPDVTWRNGRGCPLVVHCWADLQSVRGFRCYDNIARTRNASECLYSLYAWFRHWQISRHNAYNKRSNSHSSQCCPAVSASVFFIKFRWLIHAKQRSLIIRVTWPKTKHTRHLTSMQKFTLYWHFIGEGNKVQRTTKIIFRDDFFTAKCEQAATFDVTHIRKRNRLACSTVKNIVSVGLHCNLRFVKKS